VPELVFEILANGQIVLKDDDFLDGHSQDDEWRRYSLAA
jgi:hypothetical protein